MRKTIQFLAGALEVLLVLCCTMLPSSNRKRKNQMGLNLAIVVGTQQVLCFLPIGRENF
jgi:hypothetical protein